MLLKTMGARVAQPAAGGETTTTTIGAGCHFSGELRFDESVHIDGRVEGEIRGEKLVVVGPAARIEASIHADSVVVHGRVEGPIHARRKITLHATADVTSDMRTAGITIEEGASFKGRIDIGSEKPEPAVRPEPTPQLETKAPKKAAAA